MSEAGRLRLEFAGKVEAIMRKRYERALALYRKDSIAEQELESAELDLAKAELELALARLTETE